jgi:hypothetical protein
MLRLFRYNVDGQRSKIVAEGNPMSPAFLGQSQLPAGYRDIPLADISLPAHKDLGLLSLVMSDTPGLEVCDPHGRRWFPLYVCLQDTHPLEIPSKRKHVTSPSIVLTRVSYRERTYRSPVLLAGRQLECLSNNRYRSGGHLVRSYPAQLLDHSGEAPTPRAPYRYSIVFVLRAHSPIPINTDTLTTTVTGKFLRPLKGITAGELFRNIQAGHFNINAGMEERDEQKRKLAERKQHDSMRCGGSEDETRDIQAAEKRNEPTATTISDHSKTGILNQQRKMATGVKTQV